MHRFTDGHETALSVESVATLHAAALPVGSVEISTADPETPAHKL